jgi:hypothetical protein
MKKSRAEPKQILKKPTKPVDIKKLRMKIKSHIYNKLVVNHNTSQENYSNKVIDTLIFNKNTHLSIAFKESMLLDFGDEFLKR